MCQYMRIDEAVYGEGWETWDEWEVGIDVAIYTDGCSSILRGDIGRIGMNRRFG